MTAPAHITDWMPTFCGLAGYTPEKDLRWDGQNIWPLLTGMGSAKSRTIYAAGPGFRSQAIRDGDWKLVIHDDGAAKKGAKAEPEKVELFDLAKDPNETTDLGPTIPEKVAALRAKLAEVSKADHKSVAND